MEPRDIVRDFDAYFDIVPAVDNALRDEVFHIRYQVYAEELGWENTEQFPEGKERDEFDHRSIHCLLKHRATEQFVGCVRLVLPDASDPDAPLPIEQVYGKQLDLYGSETNGASRQLVGEISRIAVVSAFRHRPGEKNHPLTTVEDPGKSDAHGRRRFPHIALGLYLAAAAVGVARDLHAVVALMEPKLARRLRIFGMNFEQVGTPIEHHGQRAGYRLTHDGFRAGLSPPISALFEFVQKKIAAE